MTKKLSQKQSEIIKNFYIKKEEKLEISKEKNTIIEEIKTENNSEKLAEFIENKWFPTYRNWASCGANVWEALIDYGVEWLPTSGRDWYKWADILDKNSNFTKEALQDPYSASAWAILVYDKWYSNNSDRRNYWHVEIKTKNWFWSWWKQKTKAGLNITDWFIGFAYYLK